MTRTGEPKSPKQSAVQFPIDLRNVTRVFGSRIVVDDVSLRVARGTTYGFIGLNGAGKTTTIRMMAGLLAPTIGAITIAGCPIPEDRDLVKTKVGYVPDRPNVYPWFTVREAIVFARSFYPGWNSDYCSELLKMFRLDLKQKCGKLSKGQGAKLSLLLAMCHEPEVLILDEPTSGFDPLVREEFLEGVLSVTSQREQTVFFSSHSLADVQRLADHVGLLHEGKLLVNRPVAELVETTKRIRMVLEDDAGPAVVPPGVIHQQRQGREWTVTVENFAGERVEFLKSGNRVSHLEVEDLSLDDVFKDYVRGKQEAK
jgi:ABC-2 type transport system ATP-binding protein